MPFRARAVQVAPRLRDPGGQRGGLRRAPGDPPFPGGDRPGHPCVVRRQTPGQPDQRRGRLPGLGRQRAVTDQAGQVPDGIPGRADIGRRARSPASTAMTAAGTASRPAGGIAR